MKKRSESMKITTCNFKLSNLQKNVFLDVKNAITRSAKRKKIGTKVLGIRINNPVFLDDYLTKKTKEILAKAKKQQKEGVLAFVWTRDGGVFVRDSPDGRALKIASLEQLQVASVTADQNQAERLTPINVAQSSSNMMETGNKGEKRTIDQCSPDENNIINVHSTLDKFKFTKN